MAKKKKTVLAYNLIAFRKKAILTQTQVAEALGVDRSTYAYYETGATTPKFNTLLKLAQLYNISIDDILGGDLEDVSAKSDDDHFTDVNFIQAFNELSDKEKILILTYRTFNNDEKAEVEKSINQIKRVDK